MKLPLEIEKVSFRKKDNSLGPYPPLGFVPLPEAQLGNGDYFGLYWPIGKENEEPVICDMLHDEWALELSFSSLQKFIEWLDLNDWERGDGEVDDDNFAPYIYHKAKYLFSGNNPDKILEYLKLACDSFGEVSDFWFSYSSQLRRFGKVEESFKSALKAYNSNWVFGMPSQGVLRILQNPKAIEIIPNDPIVKNIKRLSLAYGGVKENSNYKILNECIEEYFLNKQYVEGLIAYQNYGYMMYMETNAFQERNNFSLDIWQQNFSTCADDFYFLNNMLSLNETATSSMGSFEGFMGSNGNYMGLSTQPYVIPAQLFNACTMVQVRDKIKKGNLSDS